MQQFSYYWDGKRQTRTDREFLRELAEDCDNHKEIIDGIERSKEAFDKSLA